MIGCAWIDGKLYLYDAYNPREYMNDVIARMPYYKKATHEELLELLQHKWKLQHPESVLIKQGEESGKHYWLTATYRFNKTIATATTRFIVTVAIALYKGSIPVARRMLTIKIKHINVWQPPKTCNIKGLKANPLQELARRTTHYLLKQYSYLYTWDLQSLFFLYLVHPI